MNRIPLVCLPTPLHRLPRLSAELGVDLWIKRDDLTGFALGGNKGRKLEFLMGQAVEQGAEAVVTCGALQSNFIRQLGAACSVVGLKCAAVAMELPFEQVPPQGARLSTKTGNVYLDQIFGVDLRIVADGPWDDLYAQAEELSQEYERKGLRVYRIPVGGSSPLGAYALWLAGQEILDSGETFDWIVTASSSGSTQTGLAYAFAGTTTKVLGICSDPEPEMVHDLATLGFKLAPLIGVKRILTTEDFLLDTTFVGPGYGLPSEEGTAAMRHMARKEGILLDPIYTGKAFGGLMELVKNGSVSGKVLFWHTGGIPTLFAIPEV